MRAPYGWQVEVLLLFLLLLLALLTGCTSSPGSASNQGPSCDALAPGDPAAGEQLFRETLRLTGAPTCITCHVVDAGEPEMVGPGLTSIAVTADVRLAEESAETYVCRSILAPNEYIVSGYNAGIMPRTYPLYLSQQQLNDLTTYLMTLK
jgi:cytochrome c